MLGIFSFVTSKQKCLHTFASGIERRSHVSLVSETGEAVSNLSRVTTRREVRKIPDKTKQTLSGLF